MWKVWKSSLFLAKRHNPLCPLGSAADFKSVSGFVGPPLPFPGEWGKRKKFAISSFSLAFQPEPGIFSAGFP